MDKKTSNNISRMADFDVCGRNLIINVKEDLDFKCADYIKECTDKIIDSNNIRNIIVNFKDVDFMDSSGIGVIMGRYKKIMYSGGKMAAVNMSASVERIYNISGLSKIVKKYKNLKEAFDKIDAEIKK